MSISVSENSNNNSWDVCIKEGLIIYTGTIRSEDFSKCINPLFYRRILTEAIEGFGKQFNDQTNQIETSFEGLIGRQVISELVEDIFQNDIKLSWVIKIKIFNSFFCYEESIKTSLTSQPMDPTSIVNEYEAKFEKLERKYAELSSKYDAKCNEVEELKLRIRKLCGTKTGVSAFQPIPAVSKPIPPVTQSIPSVSRVNYNNFNPNPDDNFYEIMKKWLNSNQIQTKYNQKFDKVIDLS